MNRSIRLSILALLGFCCAACGTAPKSQERFVSEIYVVCTEITAALEQDPKTIAEYRIKNNRNVFLYRDRMGGHLPYFDGLYDQDGEMSSDVRKKIERAGSWGIRIPDTGCPHTPKNLDFEYIADYNRFALRLASELK